MIRTMIRSLTCLGAFAVLAAGLSGGPLSPSAPTAAKVLAEEDKKLTLDEARQLEDLRDGRKTVDDQAKVLVAKAARWYAYQLTYPGFHKSSSPTIYDKVKEGLDKGLTHDKVKDALDKGTAPKRPDPVYLKEYSKEQIAAAKQVYIGHAKPLVRINLTRLLAGLALMQEEEVADIFLELIKDPAESDAVKHYALIGLRDLFLHTKMAPARENKCIQAVLEFAGRPLPARLQPVLKPGAGQTLEEKELLKEVDAFRWLRRDALRVLGESRQPIAPGAKAKEGQTALFLARAMRGVGLTPVPTLSEQTDAAIGLCKMQVTKDLAADYAVAQFGEFMADYATQYNARATENLGFPWKARTADLIRALDELSKQAAGLPPTEANFVTPILSGIRAELVLIETNKDPTPGNITNLLKSPPTNKALYKGVADSTVGP